MHAVDDSSKRTSVGMCSKHLLGLLLGQNSSFLGSLSVVLCCPQPRLKASRDVDRGQHFLLHSRLGSLQFPCQLQVHGPELTTMQASSNSMLDAQLCGMCTNSGNAECQALCFTQNLDSVIAEC